MAGVELDIAGGEALGGAALMRFGRVRAAAAAYHHRRPGLRPEAFERDRILHHRDRVRRIAGERPGPQRRIEIGKHAALASSGEGPVASSVETRGVERLTTSLIRSPSKRAKASTKTSRRMRSRINSAVRHTTMPPALVPTSTTSFRSS